MKHTSTHQFSGEDALSLNYNPEKDEFKDIDEFSAIFHGLDDCFEVDDSITKKIMEFAKSYPQAGN
jgi:hypothetical protein